MIIPVHMQASICVEKNDIFCYWNLFLASESWGKAAYVLPSEVDWKVEIVVFGKLQ